MSEQSYTQPPDALVGTVLAGRYRILQKLGEGAMGAVYLGEHIKMGRQDAIKVLRDSLSTDREAIARFTRGARNVAAVQHPNVCTVYDYGDTQEGLPFLAMEFIPGDSLKELLDREGRLPLERAVKIAVQVAGALQAAHDAEIVHRDLKPANIMIMRARDGSDAVRVVDFDIAKGARDGEESELTRLGFVVGTPEYMSPEQLMGERLDGRSDLYSLGLVLFRMLTGTLPFRADSPQELMIQRLTVAPLPLAEALPGAAFPPGLEAVLQRSLARRPIDRQAGGAEFARELQAACAGAPATGSPAAVVAPPPAAEEIPATRLAAAPVAPAATAPGVPAAPRPMRGRTPFVVAAVAVVVALAGAGGVLWQRAQGEQARQTAAARLPEVTGPATSALVPGGNAGGVAPAQHAEVHETPDPSRPTSTAAPPPTAKPEPAAEEPRAAETPRESAPTGTPATSGAGAAPGITVPLAGATDLLWRQLDRLGPPYPSHSALAAIRDSVHAVWDLDGVAAQDRALAAYILGSTWYALGNSPECATWIQRALQLRPDGPGYHTMLDNCRS
ncbi:MAG TPA: protein kinase [Longimicrobiaceae bacterium]|nr:protein kinase [Longimicrobiaceae bacterium]